MTNGPKVYPEPQSDRGAIVIRGVCGILYGEKVEHSFTDAIHQMKQL